MRDTLVTANERPRERKESADNQPGLSKFVRLLLILVVSVGASLTVLTHFAQISGMAFSTYTIVSTYVLVVVIAIVLWSGTSERVFSAVAEQPRTALLLFACGLMGASLSLASHRENSDDAYYVSNVIYYLAYPENPMGFDIHFIDSGNEPLVSSHVLTSLPFELAQGVVAHVGHIRFLTVYYFLTPALLGFMMPLVWFYLISRFSFRPRAAAVGTLLICLSLLLMGEKYRSYGNFAFNRIFQGKTVLFVIIVPFFVATTMDFFRSRSATAWLYLFVTSVAAIGLSTTSCMAIPVLSVVLAIACCISYVPNMRSRALLGLCYLCTLVYPALYAASFLLGSLHVAGPHASLNHPWADSFLGQAQYVFGLWTILFLVTAVILAIILLPKRHRCFLIAWILLLSVCFLNPWVAPLIMRYVTSDLIYWRLFFLLPFPLVVGLCGAGLGQYLEGRSLKRPYLTVGVLAVPLLLAHLPTSSPSVFRHGTRLGFLRYHVPELALARQVLKLAPPGTMLAMKGISCAIPMLSAQYPQIVIRRGDILLWMDRAGMREEAEHRARAHDFLSGQRNKKNLINKENLDSLIWVIRRHPQIRSVVASARAAKAYDSYLFRLLGEHGFTEHKDTEKLVLFIRPVRHPEEEHD